MASSEPSVSLRRDVAETSPSCRASRERRTSSITCASASACFRREAKSRSSADRENGRSLERAMRRDGDVFG